MEYYEKKYKEALERAKKVHNERQAQPFNVMLKVFPELAENKDERIRKEIISAVNLYCTSYCRGTKVREDMLAWLEKQEESQVYETEDGEIITYSETDGYRIYEADEIFPELKEDEFERIRKALIDYFDDAKKADENPLKNYGIHTDKALEWLENVKKD